MACTLPSKGQETGVWSVPAVTGIPGDMQVQEMGVASFPLRLKETATITAKYRNEKESEAPEPPCVGSQNEPFAEPGFLCVYRGGNFGSLESQDKNAKFFNFEKPNGQLLIPGEVGVLGVLIAFRSNQFTEEGTTPAKLTAETYLDAGGSWAVTEK
jgi:hypothetical protein